MNLVVQENKRISKRFVQFIDSTQFEVDKDVNPGGYYKAIWARDAAFILKDQFLSGNYISILDEILLIWYNQIGTDVSPLLFHYGNPKRRPLLFGRGSPELDFKSSIANSTIINKFDGAIPTTIYYDKGFCEVYGQNPDIDSTALMIYITSWILSNIIEFKDDDTNSNLQQRVTNIQLKGEDKKQKGFFSNISLSDIIYFLIPRMLKAVKYLASRDLDNDGLLEQKHNEDWMDTLLRTGKVVYSQACWILALNSLSILLKKIGNENESKNIKSMSDRTISSVEAILWSNKDKCYIDHLNADMHLDEKMHNRLLTQDVSLYLIALTEKNQDVSINNNKKITFRQRGQDECNNNLSSRDQQRAIDTLDTLKKRIWKSQLPLVTEQEVNKTGPWLLKPNEYHNHTFWAWITGIEMLARTRFEKKDDFNHLLSMFVSENKINSNMLHEWVDPVTFQGNGAYPFRTGISSVRIAAMEHLGKNSLK